MTTPIEKDIMTNQTVTELIERSNRLGADKKNTNYAGGNTSAKGIDVDPVTGEDVELVWVKGSGGDLGTLTESGLAALRLDRMRALVNVYPGVEREDEMVAAFDYCLHGKGGAAPSIDTAMHGLVDAAHVDHLHPDAGIAIATAADGEELTAQGLRRQGGLGALAAPRLPARPRHRRDQGGQPATRSAASSVATGSRPGATPPRRPSAGSLWIIDTAAAYIEANTKPEPFGPALEGYAALPEAERRSKAAALAPTIRGIASHDRPMVGHFTDDAAVLEFLASAEHPRLAALGTSCPDHFLRTKVKPLVLDLPAGATVEECVARLGELAVAYREDYQAYYDRNAVRQARPPPGRRSAAPTRWSCWCPGSGCSPTARTSRPRAWPVSSTSTRST